MALPCTEPSETATLAPRAQLWPQRCRAALAGPGKFANFTGHDVFDGVFVTDGLLMFVILFDTGDNVTYIDHLVGLCLNSACLTLCSHCPGLTIHVLELVVFGHPDLGLTSLLCS